MTQQNLPPPLPEPGETSPPVIAYRAQEPRRLHDKNILKPAKEPASLYAWLLLIGLVITGFVIMAPNMDRRGNIEAHIEWAWLAVGIEFLIAGALCVFIRKMKTAEILETPITYCMGIGEIRVLGTLTEQDRHEAATYLMEDKHPTSPRRFSLRMFVWVLIMGGLIALFILFHPPGKNPPATQVATAPHVDSVAGDIGIAGVAGGLLSLLLLMKVFGAQANDEEKVQIGWTDEGVVAASARHAQLIKWNHFEDILDTPNIFILRDKGSKNRGTVIPKRGFTGEQANRFLEIANAHLPMGGTYA